MAVIQFIKGINESTLPSVYITRSRDGTTGTATFRFVDAELLSPQVFMEGEVLGMSLLDKEGQLFTSSISVRFVNGKPRAIEVIYIIKTFPQWERFIRFMKRYASVNGLTFVKPKSFS
jgi:photosystem II protein